MTKTKSRITILDGFRAVAILAVMLFHYFSRWAASNGQHSIYPYNNQYDYFKYGFLGVEFFFIISGFVIFYTLDNTDHFLIFWKKRLIRLLPSIIVASLLTFTIFISFDADFIFPESHYIRNFLPSLTFITPSLFNNIFSGRYHFDYLNGSYWSLWPEIQFYLFVALIFYLNKRTFIRNFIVASFFLISLNYLLSNIQESNRLNIKLPAILLTTYSTWVQGGFNLITYLPWFAMGVIFYLLYKNRQLNIKSSLFIKVSLGIFLASQLYFGFQWEIRLIYLLMFILFSCFIYYPDKLSFFKNRIMVNIGVSSYFLYLIHENIGVFIIHSLGHYFSPFYIILPILLILSLITFSILYTKKIDNKLNRYLKKAILTDHLRVGKELAAVKHEVIAIEVLPLAAPSGTGMDQVKEVGEMESTKEAS